MSKAFLYGVGRKPALLGNKSITENGTYLASDDNLDGYSSVEVNVEGGGGSQNTGVRFIDYDGTVLATFPVGPGIVAPTPPDYSLPDHDNQRPALTRRME